MAKEPKQPKVTQQKICFICDKPLSDKYLDWMKTHAVVEGYLDTCYEHRQFRYAFDKNLPPGGNLEYMKHLRVEYGND